MNKKDVINDLAIQISWIRNNENHQFPGWMNTVNAMTNAIKLLQIPEECENCAMAIEDHRIIHCEECRYCDPIPFERDLLWCNLHSYGRRADHYCSDGLERRTGNG